MTTALLPRRFFGRAMISIVASGTLGLPSTSAAADAQPNALKFGSIRVGATVEGSLRIFREGVDAVGLPVKIEPPAFVRVENVQIGSQQFGPRTRGFCDIWVSLDTKRAGEYSGELRVEMGREKVAIPIAATVRPQMPRMTRLLVAQTPFTRFSTGNARLFDPWLQVIGDGHFDVHYLDPRPGMPVLGKVNLEKIDVVLLGQGGLLHLDDSEIKLLRGFVERGGRAVVAANYFYRGTVAKANELLKPSGLQMRDTEPSDRHEFLLRGDEIANDPLTTGLRSVYFWRPSPVAVTDPKRGKVLVSAPGYPGDGFVAVGHSGRGEVIALGDSLWWSWLGRDKAKGSQNVLLMRDLLMKTDRRK